MKTIIMIGHKKRQGKDTFAKMLAEITGGEIIRFADPMKQIIADTFGMSLSRLERLKNDDEKLQHDTALGMEHETQTYRQILQRFGEAMKQKYGEEVWAGLATNAAWYSKSDVVIVPDLRFEIEYLVMKRAFNDRVVTVNVTRQGTKTGDTHPSETELDGFDYDYYIENSGTLDNLKTEAVFFAIELGLNKDMK